MKKVDILRNLINKELFFSDQAFDFLIHCPCHKTWIYLMDGWKRHNLDWLPVILTAIALRHQNICLRQWNLQFYMAGGWFQGVMRAGCVLTGVCTKALKIWRFLKANLLLIWIIYIGYFICLLVVLLPNFLFKRWTIIFVRYALLFPMVNNIKFNFWEIKWLIFKN